MAFCHSVIHVLRGAKGVGVSVKKTHACGMGKLNSHWQTLLFKRSSESSTLLTFVCVVRKPVLSGYLFYCWPLFFACVQRSTTVLL